VLQTLIAQQVLEQALAANGGAASQAELDQLRDSVLQGSTEAQLTSEITKSNFTASFEPVYVRTQELFGVYGKRTNATSSDEVIASVNKHDIGVQVSPRYGTWDASQFGLQGAGVASGLTSVLTIGSASPSS
jgi:hypothetical protein